MMKPEKTPRKKAGPRRPAEKTAPTGAAAPAAPKAKARTAKAKTAKTRPTTSAAKGTKTASAAKPKRVAARKAAPRKKSPPAKTPTRAKAAKPKAPRHSRTAIPEAAAVPPVTEKAPLPIPPVLLEGDTSPPEPAGGPGQRYALGPVPPPEHGETDAVRGDLPESYGTGRLFVTARDPHWLYAWWDLSREQQSRCNALAANHHLTLRVFKDNAEGDPLDQIPVHPESRFWFAPVPHAGSRYVVELGYFMPSDRWVRVAVSRPTLTPADTLSGDAGAEFVTIPQDVPFAQLMVLVKEAARDQTPLARALGELRDSGHPGLPADQVPHAGHWSAEQEHALAEVLSMDAVRRVWLGSLEITELVRRQLARELSSAALAQAVSPAGAVSSISSPMGGAPGRRGFWFNVNAELVLYGATEPNAAVTIADRPIKLRPDGTFSFRFALPDGAYQLDARAVSADGADARVAGLKFTRATSHRGGVDAHAQDPALKPPGADAVA